MKTNLDEYDFQLIDICKRGNSNKSSEMKLLWSKRCGLDLEHVELEYIVDRMIEIYELFPTRGYNSNFHRLLIEMNPSRDWSRGIEIVGTESEKHILRLFDVLRSAISGTLVADIPGYREYIDKRGNY